MVALSNLRFSRTGCRCSLSFIHFKVWGLHHQKANLFGETELVYPNKSLKSEAYWNVEDLTQIVEFLRFYH